MESVDDVLGWNDVDDDDRYFDDWLGALVANDAAIDPHAASSSDQDASRRKRRRTSLRDEILHLRAKHATLTAQLQALAVNSAVVPAPSSIWADRAKNQAIAAQQALHENARLQELLRDQLKTIATLQRAFARRPKLCDFACVAPWKMASLGTTGRREAKAKLLQHQYDLLDTEWIRHGLYDLAAAGENVHKHFMQVVDDALCVHFVEHRRWATDLSTLANVLWGMLTRQLKPQPQVYCVAEEVESDDDIVYFRYVASVVNTSLPPIQGQLLARRFVEADRIVFVTRSIVNDALFPADPAHLVDNQCCWIIVQKCGAQGAQLTSFARFTPPMVPPESPIGDFTPGVYTECILHLINQSGISLSDTIQHVLDDPDAAV